MTIKEIAELCGVGRRTVERWAHKIADDPGQNDQGLTIKLKEAEKSGKDPADFTLEETLAIIGEGGGNKTLAALLAENAKNKNALAGIEIMDNPMTIIRKAMQLAEIAVNNHVSDTVHAWRAAEAVDRLVQRCRKTGKQVNNYHTKKLFEWAVCLADYYHYAEKFFEASKLHSRALDAKIIYAQSAMEEAEQLRAKGVDVPIEQTRKWLVKLWDFFHEVGSRNSKLPYYVENILDSKLEPWLYKCLG
jgi:hypothetical protein